MAVERASAVHIDGKKVGGPGLSVAGQNGNLELFGQCEEIADPLTFARETVEGRTTEGKDEDRGRSTNATPMDRSWRK